MRVWKIALVATVFSIMMHTYLYVMLSKMRAYNQVQLGDPVDKVDSLLSDGLGYCGDIAKLSRGTPSRATCLFRDPWHTYQLVINADTGRVVIKSVTWTRPGRGITPLAQRVMGWVYP